MTTPLAAGDEASARGKKALFRFVFGFLCVFGGLALPSPGLGPLYTRAHTALGNAIIEDRAFASGFRLSFQASEEELGQEPWQTMLVITPPASGPVNKVAVDLRTLGYLPTVAFIALAVAMPVRSLRRNLGVLFLGLGILVPLLVLLIALPLVSFLGGQGPVAVYSLGAAGHVVVNVIYRALVAPPGMAYALPLLLFWALLQIPADAFDRVRIFTKFQRKIRHDVTRASSDPS